MEYLTCIQMPPRYNRLLLDKELQGLSLKVGRLVGEQTIEKLCYKTTAITNSIALEQLDNSFAGQGLQDEVDWSLSSSSV